MSFPMRPCHVYTILSAAATSHHVTHRILSHFLIDRTTVVIDITSSCHMIYQEESTVDVRDHRERPGAAYNVSDGADVDVTIWNAMRCVHAI